MDKRAEIIHDEDIAERFVGPTAIERTSRSGFSGFRNVGGEQPIGGRGLGRTLERDCVPDRR